MIQCNLTKNHWNYTKVVFTSTSTPLLDNTLFLLLLHRFKVGKLLICVIILIPIADTAYDSRRLKDFFHVTRKPGTHR